MSAPVPFVPRHSPTGELIEELNALDVPVALIARATHLSVENVWNFLRFHQLAHQATPADRGRAERIARSARIKTHIADYPSRPLFSGAA